MTRAVFSGTQHAYTDNDGRKQYTAGGGVAPVVTATSATVAADVATLVADGATPTQAHVTTLNTDWAALLAQINALAAETGDFYFSYDVAKITTLNDLNTALDSIRRQAQSAGLT